MGSAVDEMFPDYSELKSEVVTALELSAQFSLGFLALSEVMNVLIPKTEYYRSPIGDGQAIYWFYSTQPTMFKKINRLRSVALASIKSSFFRLPEEEDPKSVKVPAASK